VRPAAAALTCASIALVLIASGCGSGSSKHATAAASSAATPPRLSDPIAEIKASGEQIAADIESSRFERACEGFTQATRAKFAAFPEGCAGALSLARAAGHAGARTFGHLLRAALLGRLAHFQIHGYEALYKGVREALYEEGRWRFEGQSSGFTTTHKT